MLNLGLLLCLHIQHRFVFQMVEELFHSPLPSWKVRFINEEGIGGKTKHGGKGYLNVCGASAHPRCKTPAFHWVVSRMRMPPAGTWVRQPSFLEDYNNLSGKVVALGICTHKM